MRAALERLPADQREVPILRHIAGMTPPQIAEVLGKPKARSTACPTADVVHSKPPCAS